MPLDRSHIVKSYEHELDHLRTLMAEMGRQVEEQVGLSLVAIADHDEQAAHKAVSEDPQVDAMERDVEGLVIRLLALRSPMGGDLREIVAALKITGDLERIGDYAASIARKAIKAGAEGGSVPVSGLLSMGKLVKENFHRTVEALTHMDPELAIEVWHSDKQVDEYYTTLFRELVTYMMEDPRNIRPCTELLFVAKNFERIGDHATNIAERIYYAVTGDNLPTERPKGGKQESKN